MTLKNLPGEYFIRFVYQFPTDNPSPDDFVGPFPAFEFAEVFRKNFGPVGGKVTIIPPKDVNPDHCMSPGEFLDYTLARCG